MGQLFLQSTSSTSKWLGERGTSQSSENSSSRMRDDAEQCGIWRYDHWLSHLRATFQDLTEPKRDIWPGIGPLSRRLHHKWWHMWAHTVGAPILGGKFLCYTWQLALVLFGLGHFGEDGWWTTGTWLHGHIQAWPLAGKSGTMGWSQLPPVHKQWQAPIPR